MRHLVVYRLLWLVGYCSVRSGETKLRSRGDIRVHGYHTYGVTAL